MPRMRRFFTRNDPSWRSEIQRQTVFGQHPIALLNQYGV